jgi:hypothetical protein
MDTLVRRVGAAHVEDVHRREHHRRCRHQQPWNVTASVNYVGTYNLTDPSVGLATCQQAIQTGGLGGPQLTRFPFPAPYPAAAASLLQYCDVKAFTDVDLYTQYAFSKGTSACTARS